MSWLMHSRIPQLITRPGAPVRPILKWQLGPDVWGWIAIPARRNRACFLKWQLSPDVWGWIAIPARRNRACFPKWQLGPDVWGWIAIPARGARRGRRARVLGAADRQNRRKPLRRQRPRRA